MVLAAFASAIVPADTIADDVRIAPIGAVAEQRPQFLRFHPAFRPGFAPDSPDARFFPETGHTLVNGFRGTWESGDTGERLGLPVSEEFSIGKTVYQDCERVALYWDPDLCVSIVATGINDAAAHGQLQLTGRRPAGVPSYAELAGQPRSGGPGEHRIDVNLSIYRLTAHEGSVPVCTTAFVDGASGTPTVQGTFFIHWTLDTQTSHGNSADGTEYVTPDVPWVMCFYADFALPGAYWRDSFGYSGSHGCVNLPVGDAAWLYSWTSVGTRVEVYD